MGRWEAAHFTERGMELNLHHVGTLFSFLSVASLYPLKRPGMSLDVFLRTKPSQDLHDWENYKSNELLMLPLKLYQDICFTFRTRLRGIMQVSGALTYINSCYHLFHAYLVSDSSWTLCILLTHLVLPAAR